MKSFAKLVPQVHLIKYLTATIHILCHDRKLWLNVMVGHILYQLKD